MKPQQVRLWLNNFFWENFVKKDRMPCYISKWPLFPSPLLEARGDFFLSDIYCETLVELQELEFTKCVGVLQ